MKCPLLITIICMLYLPLMGQAGVINGSYSVGPLIPFFRFQASCLFVERPCDLSGGSLLSQYHQFRGFLVATWWWVPRLVFWAVAEHRIIPARARGVTTSRRASGIQSVWAPACQDSILCVHAGVRVVSFHGAPWTLRTLATPVFGEFFGLGGAIRVVLLLGNGGVAHLFVVYGYQVAEDDPDQLVLSDQVLRNRKGSRILSWTRRIREDSPPQSHPLVSDLILFLLLLIWFAIRALPQVVLVELHIVDAQFQRAWVPYFWRDGHPSVTCHAFLEFVGDYLPQSHVLDLPREMR